MSRNTFISDRFNCKLHCGGCQHIKAGGGRCRNRVCFGVPLCWIHTKIVYGVQVRDSTLADAGNPRAEIVPSKILIANSI